MSEIKNKILKILEESNLSFKEDVSVQPDMFGGKDTYYKDGRQALSFMDVLDYMSRIAPEMDFVDQKENNGLYWMVFEGNRPFNFDDIKQKLKDRFGDAVSVKLARSQYAPEQKKLYIGFVDVADVEADSMEEASEDVSVQPDMFNVGDLVIKGGNFGRIKNIYKVFGKDTFELETLDSGSLVDPLDGYKTITPEEVMAFLRKDESLDEGWKDAFSSAGKYAKGALTGAAMAGSLITGANAADIQYGNPTMSQEQIEQLKIEDQKAERLPNGMIKDQYGNEWTTKDWAELMRGEDPYNDNDHHMEDEEYARAQK